MGYKVPADGQTPKDLTRFLAHLVLEFDIIYSLTGTANVPAREGPWLGKSLQHNVSRGT